MPNDLVAVALATAFAIARSLVRAQTSGASARPNVLLRNLAPPAGDDLHAPRCREMMTRQHPGTMSSLNQMAAILRSAAVRIPAIRRLVGERDALRAELARVVTELARVATERDSFRAEIEREVARRKASAPELFARQYGVLFIGYAEGALGLGQAFRANLAAAAAAAIPFGIYPLRAGIETRLLAPCMPDRYDHVHAYDLNIIQVAVDQLPVVFRAVHPSVFEGSYNILVPYWELPTAPKEWEKYLERIDEIWAPTEFIANAFAHIFSRPIVIMRPAMLQSGDIHAARAHYGIEESRFYFMFSFDYFSSPFRKNPLGVIEAFQRAFPIGTENVGLVVKSTGAPEHYPEIKATIRGAADRDPRILLNDENLSRDDMLGLIRTCDAYVSMHRSEGFGLGMAEALSFGRIVIGTDYSGCTGFLNEETGYPVPYSLRPVLPHEYPYSDGQVWAEPDLAAAAEIMRKVAANPGEGRSRAVAGQTLVSKQYSMESVGPLMRARLSELLELRRKWS